MRRREFIKVAVGSATAWTYAARAQQLERRPRIGVLMNRRADNPEGQARLTAFQQALEKLGWNDGGNVSIDIRWGEDDIGREDKYAADLVALTPDVILASGSLSVAALRRVSRTLPVVFIGVTDPVGAGFVDSLARPGGNITGFMIYEYSFGGKRLELLKQIAPTVTRAAVFRDPDNPAGGAEFAAIQAAAQTLRMEVSPIDSRRDADEIERAITTFARSPNAGLILTPNSSVSVPLDLVVTLAAKYKLPVVYPFRYMPIAAHRCLFIRLSPDARPLSDNSGHWTGANGRVVASLIPRELEATITPVTERMSNAQLDAIIARGIEGGLDPAAPDQEGADHSVDRRASAASSLRRTHRLPAL
jgi:putative ABC transport system substrate-binding protein